MMSKEQWVDSLSEGTGVDDLFQVEVCDLRQARNGSLYLSLVIKDRTGRVGARRWDARAEETETFKAGDVVRIRGFVESFRGQPQVIVRRIDPAAGDDVDPADFFRSSAKSPSAMLAELRAVLETVKSPPLRKLLDAFLDDPRFRERFMEAPAATHIHHAHLGGLLEHTLSMARCALAVAPNYPSLDVEVLLAGVFLHDLGKTEELATAPMLDYTDRGRLLGHIEIGARMLSEKAAAIEDFPPFLLDILTHMVLSHHGRMEYGSPKLPMTPEAVVLHLIDNLDAKVMAIESLREEAEGGRWSDYIRGFERAFFLGGAQWKGRGEEES
jgi:3'-5' exoribonuclease